ncbi:MULTISPECIES: four-carbon acid sugar kinase family protein [unclassified Bacillus (in: firmicutes)]|uniref:four-carbon acid sugar kinase family protein n=1 Tax=unclassified Bacillus (in: firmicutes) TaxID=185979 RepID=UPI00227F0BE9|nr:four-carbon acid sugar kinase family protein [Bacillus sp. S20C3]MCY8290563.1 four-carbon acid sugar kinase family protein [Bacillus sp. N13C7]MCY8640130.1 four-carbon acid sugar kinase family protein [Bacillus sp. S17B2]MCY9144364.1 four-carbon acid sugar kinase family protein [Bacillus sp. T9C1]
MTEKNLLLAFYGDDFTGSTDAMEALALNGYRTILFLDMPSPEMLGKFIGVQCIGIPGTSRAKNPNEMEQELRPMFESLFKLKTDVIHYKTCSTFDSNPEIGSIGKAIEIALDYTEQQKAVPIFVAAPPLGRYTLFGNHFARMYDTVYRLDRHPTMSKHPMTPMNESDLRVHLNKQFQTPKQIGLMDVVELSGDYSHVKEVYEQKLASSNDIVLFDGMDNSHCQKVGRLLWEKSQEGLRFIVGSSGVEYALTAEWKRRGLQASSNKKEQIKISAVNQVLVVAGSCSPITKNQIDSAIEAGFVGIQISPQDIINKEELPKDLLDKVIKHIKNGKSVILYTARGSEDSAIAETRRLFDEMGIKKRESGELIGSQLGKWTLEIMKITSIRRIIVAGGDTSGFVTKELKIFALEMILPIDPGVPLCCGYSSDPTINGIEIALKGGQMGSPEFFAKIKEATSSDAETLNDMTLKY